MVESEANLKAVMIAETVVFECVAEIVVVAGEAEVCELVTGIQGRG